jgi:hypothetical protein
MLIVEFRVKRQDNMAESWHQILNHQRAQK